MLSFIPSSYRKVLRFFRMSSPTLDCELPKGRTSVHILTYCDFIQETYKNQGVARMNKYHVDEVNLYKTRAQSRHEYISAKVTSSEGTFYLAFERVRGEIEDKAKGSVKKMVSSVPTVADMPTSVSTSVAAIPTSVSTSVAAVPTSVSTSVAAVPTSVSTSVAAVPTSAASVAKAISDSLTPQYIAQDIVTLLKDVAYDTSSDECFRTVYFSPPLPLYQLATLAKTVHNTETRYFLFAENCYWYAGTIIKALQDLKDYSPRWYVETTGSAAVDAEFHVARSKTLQKGETKRDKAGDWHRIPIYNDANVDTEELRHRFEKEWTGFKKKVEDAEKQLQAKDEENARLKEENARVKKAAEQENARVKKAAEEEIVHVKKAAEAKEKAQAEENARLKRAAEAQDEEIAALKAQLKRAIPSTSTGGF